MIFLALLVLAIGCFCYCIIKQYQTYKEIAHIPGPRPLPFLGNVLELGTNPVEFLTNLLRLSQKYGSVTRLCVGPRNGILITDPKHISEVLTAAQHCSKSDYYDVLRPLLGDDSIVLCTGEKWIRQRKVLNTAFSMKQLEKYISAFNETANNFVEELNEKVHLDSVDVTQTVFSNALNAICKTAMNIDISKNTEYHNATTKLWKLFLKRLTSPLQRFDCLFRLTEDYKKTTKYLSIVHGVVDTVIRNHKQKPKGNSANTAGSSILDLLFRLNKEDSLGANEMQGQIQTFILAGTDTIGTTLSFAMYELAKHPNLQTKILEETQSILSVNPRDDIHFEDLHELKYTECVLKEVMRLYSPVPLIPRVIPKDIYLSDFRIPANTTVLIFIYGLHKSGHVHPDPEKFYPDRFLPGNYGDRDAFSFIPFGGGPRKCIGNKFGMLEMKLLLAKIVQNFQLSPHQGHNLQLCIHTTLASANGLPVVLKRRKTST